MRQRSDRVINSWMSRWIKRTLFALLILYCGSLGVRGYFLNDSAKDFAKNAALDIGRDWSEETYLKLSVKPEDQKAVNKALRAADAQLGRLVSAGAVRCSFDRGLVGRLVGKVISAYCGVDVVFANGAGVFGMQLVKAEDSWKIYQFRLEGKGN